MAGFIPAIHVLMGIAASKTWMAGTSPAMTNRWLVVKTTPSESNVKRDHATF
jgi:hypothetical protein